MTIRYAVPDDVPALSAVEAECFPPAEAATAAEFAERVAHYGNHFWLMYDGDKLISFVDGFVTDKADLTDEMYENAAMHNENGAWQMIFASIRCLHIASMGMRVSCFARLLLTRRNRAVRVLS